MTSRIAALAALSPSTTLRFLTAHLCGITVYLDQLHDAALSRGHNTTSQGYEYSHVRPVLAAKIQSDLTHLRRLVKAGLGTVMADPLSCTPKQWTYRMLRLANRVESLSDTYANAGFDLIADEYQGEYSKVARAVTKHRHFIVDALAAIEAVEKGADPRRPGNGAADVLGPGRRPWDDADLTAPQLKLLECLWDANAQQPKPTRTKKQELLRAICGRRKCAGKSLNAMKDRTNHALNKVKNKAKYFIDADRLHGWILESTT